MPVNDPEPVKICPAADRPYKVHRTVFAIPKYHGKHYSVGLRRNRQQLGKPLNGGLEAGTCQP